MKKVLILGAGISGLSAAWRLKQNNPCLEVTILEKSNRCGGWIETIEKEGFLFELGPRSCRLAQNGWKTLQLASDLGLLHEVIAADPAAHIRYLWRNKRLEQLPSRWWELPFSRAAWDLGYGCFRDLVVPAGNGADESVGSFFSRRFSSTVVSEYVDPLISGIYAGDPYQLSMRSCFPSLLDWEQRFGSVMRGMFRAPHASNLPPQGVPLRQNSLFTFKRGMSTLVQSLSAMLAPQIRYGADVRSLELMQNAGAAILATGETFEADKIICTLPAHVIGSLHPSLKLNIEVPHASVACVALGYRKNVLRNPGFGYLVSSNQEEKILGCVWDSSAFSQQNQSSEETRLTVMIGGIRMTSFDTLTETDFRKIAIEAVEEQMGIEIKPDVTHVHIVKKAIPQCPVGFREVLKTLQLSLCRQLFPLELSGMAFHGVSVNDCIAGNAFMLPHDLSV